MARALSIRLGLVASAVALVIAGVACSGCPPSGGTEDVGRDGGCTISSCGELCATIGCGPDCSDGTCRCRCLPDGGDADTTDGDDGDDAVIDDARDGVDDRREGDSGDDGADAGCLYRAAGESRPGASPGVMCRRLSVDVVERVLLWFAGWGRNVVGVGVPGPSIAATTVLWRHDLDSGCWEGVAEAVGDGGRDEVMLTATIEDHRVAFSATWPHSASTVACELRLLDLETRDVQVLDRSISDASSASGGAMVCSMRPIALEYPWVVWRDIRQVGSFSGPWDVYAMNIETGERLNLSIDPDTGDRLWSAVVQVDLDSGLTVFGASWRVGEPTPARYSEIVSVDLNSGARQQVTNAAGAQWYGTVTEDWVAWVDPREDPLRDAYSLCHTDIYGFDRRTGTEHALAIDGDGMRGPTVDGEGPWLAYSDQRWDPYPECDSDQEQSIVALHLPTMTEIRITDWPGFEAEPRVYDRRDGTYGVLFIEEIDYVDAIYRLWDCDLPAP